MWFMTLTNQNILYITEMEDIGQLSQAFGMHSDLIS